MKFRNIIIIIVLILVSASCNQYEVFEKEQYKNVFALISSNDNIFEKYFDLRKTESLGYISFSMGGSNPTSKDLTINLVEDHSYIDDYNRAFYDMDVLKYGKPMPANQYDIAALETKIPAGEFGSQIPIRIRPEGLSPDSAYYIAVRVNSYSDYELNPDKSYLLYRIRIKNYWAKGEGKDGNTTYVLRGLRSHGGQKEINMPGSKVMHPLTKNTVRVMIGNETYKSDIATFNKSAMILEIDDKNNVTITPYKHANVKQVNGDPQFPNIFRVDDDGFKTYKTFLLRYDYTINDVTYQMKEELRLQFNEDEEEVIEE